MMNDIIEEKIHIKFQIGFRYIATKPSKDNRIQIGTPVYIEHNHKTPGPEYTLFGINRVGRVHGYEWNDVRYFRDLRELAKALDGVEGILDIKWARERIDEMQLKMADLKGKYCL